MKSHLLVAAAAVVALCAGCAQNGGQEQAKEEYKAPVYRTGSNIPAGRQSGDGAPAGTNSDMRNALPPSLPNRGPAG